MKIRILVCVICVFALAAQVFAQSNLKRWQSFDFTKRVVTKSQLANLDQDDLQILRGILFGRRGRIFVEKDIHQYLAKQSWYQPDENFNNSVLTVNERKNIDLIREAEAAKHEVVEPGDLRWWQAREIPEDKISANTAAEWSVLIAEVEAIHGRTFPDREWLQRYFEERYWYKPNPAYSPTILNEIERKNLENLIAKRNAERNVALSPGDMDKFQNVLLTEDLLKGLNLSELRIIRNEFWARHGKTFVTPGYRAFFEWQDWYKPAKDQTKIKLNPIEEQNVKLIQAYENKIRASLATDILPEVSVEGLFAEDLRILRNEIFARHGYIFKDKKLQQEFTALSWYKPDPTLTADKIPTVLNETEIKNVAILKKAETNAISKFSAVEG